MSNNKIKVDISMYAIKRIEVNKLIEKEVKELYLINNEIVKKYNFLDKFNGIDDNKTFKEIFLSTFISDHKKLFVVKNNSSTCGMLTWIRYIDWGDKEQYKLTIWLCDKILSRSLIECLFEFIEEKLSEYKEFAVVTYNDELENLIKRYAYKTNLKCNYYSLNRKDIEIHMLDEAINKYNKSNKDLVIKYTNVISEEYINQYCDLFSETMKDMADEKEDGYVRYSISAEKQRSINKSNAESNITHNCYMIFNADNEMIAMTNVSVNNENVRFPYQFMIGVKKEYRGRGIGKWLYASMYKRLLENVGFEKVLVCHHPENYSAINISKWIGYKFNYLETVYIIRTN